MKPRVNMLVEASSLAPIATGSLVRPELPHTMMLSTGQMRAVDLEEQMDPLAVAESTAATDRSVAALASQFFVIGVAALAIWSLLPKGVTARPPLELPAPLQAESGPITPAQQALEDTAIALLEQAVPTQALVDFRLCIDGDDRASVNLWRYYLQTLVGLDERPELRLRAKQFLTRHPDRLEAPHFECEALRRDDIEAHRERVGMWGARIAPDYLAELDRCQNTISDALNLLQQHDSDWSAAKRTAWADLLHLDRAHLHHHAWKCRGFDFADPHREQSLVAIRLMSSTTTADALALRVEIYGKCIDKWPRILFFTTKKQVVNGLEQSLDDLVRVLSEESKTLALLPPTGRR